MPQSDPLGPIHLPTWRRSRVQRELDKPFETVNGTTRASRSVGIPEVPIKRGKRRPRSLTATHRVVPFDGLSKVIKGRDIENRCKNFSLPNIIAQLGKRDCWFDKVTAVQPDAFILGTTTKDLCATALQAGDGIQVPIDLCRSRYQCHRERDETTTHGTGCMQGSIKSLSSQRITWNDPRIPLLERIEKLVVYGSMEVQSSCRCAPLTRRAYCREQHCL